MAGQVVTITSGKGGVGKTTSTANLGVALARFGKRVVCIDADIGLRNLDLSMGYESRIVYDLVDVVQGRARLHQALIQDSRLPGLQLLPAANIRDKSIVTEQQMLRLCDDLRADFDFIIIDCPAGIDTGFRNAVTPADQVLVVVTPEVASVRDGDCVVGLIEAVQKPLPRLIINRFRPLMVKRGDMLDIAEILDVLAIELIGVVPEDESVISAGNKGQPLTWEDRSPAGIAFNHIARRMLGEDVPFQDLFASNGMFNRVSQLFRK